MCRSGALSLRCGASATNATPLLTGPGRSKLTQNSGSAGSSLLAHVAARDVILIQADDPVLGLVAFVPIGMSGVSSCVIGSGITPGYHVAKGEELGYVQFGAPDVLPGVPARRHRRLRARRAPSTTRPQRAPRARQLAGGDGQACSVGLRRIGQTSRLQHRRRCRNAARLCATLEKRDPPGMRAASAELGRERPASWS